MGAMDLANSLETFRNRRVLVTGHTGFKGSWLSFWLAELGAKVIGVSDGVPTDPSLFEIIGVKERVDDRRADIRDLAGLRAILGETKPQLIFHLAAQPIVRTAIANPYETIAVNVLGTAAILEAARSTPEVTGVVVITSDKVYRDRASDRPFNESDLLGGHEPYGASKAAAEIVAHVYACANFHAGAGSLSVPTVITARAGNVIGGGDWAAHRLIPDTVRAIRQSSDIILRYPQSIRPWQHVLEPLGGYLMLGQRILNGRRVPPSVNFGPDEGAPIPVIDVVRQFLATWGPCDTRVMMEEDRSGVEATVLQVDSSLAHAELDWRAVWPARRAISESASWYRSWAHGDADMRELSRAQITEYVRDSADADRVA
jgi:CDP-glucose 4,6-dehydratase